MAAYRTAPNPDTEAALFASLATPGRPLRYFAGDGADWSTLRLLDEDRGLVADREGRLNVVDLATSALTPLGTGTGLTGVRIDEASRVAGSALVVFRGTTDQGRPVAGLFDFLTPQRCHRRSMTARSPLLPPPPTGWCSATSTAASSPWTGPQPVRRRPASSTPGTVG